MAGKDPITTKFNVDISDLKRGITEANQTIKRANAQFKAATAGMDDWEHSADGLEAKLKQLSDTITAGQKKLDNYRERVQRLEQAEAENTKRAEKLKTEYQQAAQQFGVNSKEAQRYEKALNDVEKEIIRNKDALENTRVIMLNQEAAVGRAQKEYRKFSQSLEDVRNAASKVGGELQDAESALTNVGNAADAADGGFTVMKGALADLTSNAIQKCAEAVTNLIGNLLELPEATKEYRTVFGAVQQSASDSAIGMQGVTDAYREFYKVSADEGQSAEASSHIAGLVNSQDQLKGAIDGVIGAWVEYGDSITIEGLAEAANETAKTGIVTGQFADALNWAGESEDDFNKKLSGLSSTQERQQLVVQTLNDLYGKNAQTYAENNKSLLDANAANLTLLESQSELATSIEPITALWTNMKAAALDMLAPAIELVSSAIQKASQYFSEHEGAANAAKATITGLAVAFGVLATALLIVNTIKAVQKAFSLLNVTMLANPAMLVAAGLAGLTAAVISFTKSEKESVTATDRLIDKQKEFSKTLKENKQEREGMVTTAKEEGAQADFLAERLNTLMGVEKKSAGQKEEIKSIVEQLNGIMPDLNLKYNEEKDALNKSTEAIYANIEAQKSLLIAKAMEEQQADVAEDIAATQIKLKEATDNRTTAQQKYNDAVKKAETLEQKWIDSGRSDGQLLSQWSKVENSLEGLNKEYQKADDLVKTYQGELKNLNTEYDKTSELTAQQYNTAAIEQQLASLVEKCKAKGIEVTKAVSEGIKSGQYELPKSVAQMQRLVTFNDLATKAGVEGMKIPTELAQGINSGDITAQTAVNNLKKVIRFEDLAAKAGIAGKQIPEKLKTEIALGNLKPVDAMKQLNQLVEKEVNKLPDKLEKSGKNSTNEYSKGVSSGIKKVTTAAKKVGNAAVSGEKQGSKGSKSQGSKTGSDYASGVSGKKGNAETAGKGLGSSAKSGAAAGGKGIDKSGIKAGADYALGIRKKNKDAETAGKNAGQKAKSGFKSGSSGASQLGSDIVSGAVSGVNNNSGSLYSTLSNLASNALAAAKKKLGIKSPSRVFRDQVGKQIVAGIVEGMVDGETTLASTMRSMMGQVVSIAKSGLTGQFTEAGNEAADRFSEVIQDKIDFISDKVSYLFEQKQAQYDAQLAKWESALTRRQNYDQAIKAANKEYKADVKELKKSKKYRKASKKERQKMLKELKSDYNKELKALKKQYKDVAGHTQDYYKKYLNQYKSQQEAYQSALDETLNGFNDALSDFGSKAEELVSDTINGITETYQNKWDELSSLQDSMTDKLQSFGELFTVSGAGVMDINDITEQTDQIRAYMESLTNIKGLVSEELFDQIATYDMEQGKAFVDQLLAMTEEELKAYDAAYVEKLNVSEQLAENLYKGDFDQLSKDYSNAITNALSGLSGELEALGKECMAGFIDGLSADTSYMTNAIKQIANSIITQFKKELKINSPSKVFASIGGFSAEGYGEGFIQQMKELKSNLVASVPMQSIARAGGVTTNNHQNSSNSTKTVNQTFNQYNSSPKALSRLDIYRQTKNALHFAKGV